MDYPNWGMLMGRRTDTATDHELIALRQEFTHWRHIRAKGARIPDALWTSATLMAERVGITKTALALKLDFYSLRKRVRSNNPDGSGDGAKGNGFGAASQFVELPAMAPTLATSLACTLEIAGGPKGSRSLRLDVQGITVCDLESLVRSLMSASG